MEDTQLLENTQVFLDDSFSKENDSQSHHMVGWLKIEDIKYEIYNGTTKIGRDPTVCDILLENQKTVSKEHATIEAESGSAFLMDLGSRNKTKLRKKTIKPYVQYALQGGENICFGSVNTVFIMNEDLKNDELSDAGSDSILIATQDDKVKSSAILDTSIVSPTPHCSYKSVIFESNHNKKKFLAGQDFVPETPGISDKKCLDDSDFVGESPSQSTPYVHSKSALQSFTSSTFLSPLSDVSFDSKNFKRDANVVDKKNVIPEVAFTKLDDQDNYNSDDSTDVEDIFTEENNLNSGNKKTDSGACDKDIFDMPTQQFNQRSFMETSTNIDVDTQDVLHAFTNAENKKTEDSTQDILKAFSETSPNKKDNTEDPAGSATFSPRKSSTNKMVHSTSAKKSENIYNLATQQFDENTDNKLNETDIFNMDTQHINESKDENIYDVATQRYNESPHKVKQNKKTDSINISLNEKHIESTQDVLQAFHKAEDKGKLDSTQDILYAFGEDEKFDRTASGTAFKRPTLSPLKIKKLVKDGSDQFSPSNEKSKNIIDDIELNESNIYNVATQKFEEDKLLECDAKENTELDKTQTFVGVKEKNLEGSRRSIFEAPTQIFEGGHFYNNENKVLDKLINTDEENKVNQSFKNDSKENLIVDKNETRTLEESDQKGIYDEQTNENKSDTDSNLSENLLEDQDDGNDTLAATQIFSFSCLKDKSISHEFDDDDDALVKAVGDAEIAEATASITDAEDDKSFTSENLLSGENVMEEISDSHVNKLQNEQGYNSEESTDIEEELNPINEDLQNVDKSILMSDSSIRNKTNNDEKYNSDQSTDIKKENLLSGENAMEEISDSHVNKLQNEQGYNSDESTDIEDELNPINKDLQNVDKGIFMSDSPIRNKTNYDEKYNSDQSTDIEDNQSTDIEESSPKESCIEETSKNNLKSESVNLDNQKEIKKCNDDVSENIDKPYNTPNKNSMDDTQFTSDTPYIPYSCFKFSSELISSPNSFLQSPMKCTPDSGKKLISSPNSLSQSPIICITDKIDSDEERLEKSQALFDISALDNNESDIVLSLSASKNRNRFTQSPVRKSKRNILQNFDQCSSDYAVSITALEDSHIESINNEPVEKIDSDVIGNGRNKDINQNRKNKDNNEESDKDSKRSLKVENWLKNIDDNGPSNDMLPSRKSSRNRPFKDDTLSLEVSPKKRRMGERKVNNEEETCLKNNEDKKENPKYNEKQNNIKEELILSPKDKTSKATLSNEDKNILSLEEKNEKIILEQKNEKISLEEKNEKISLEEKNEKISLEEKNEKIEFIQKESEELLDDEFVNIRTTRRGRQSKAPIKFSPEKRNNNAKFNKRSLQQKVELNQEKMEHLSTDLKNESKINNDSLLENNEYIPEKTVENAQDSSIIDKTNVRNARKTRHGRQSVSPIKYSPEKINIPKEETMDDVPDSIINGVNSKIITSYGRQNSTSTKYFYEKVNSKEETQCSQDIKTNVTTRTTRLGRQSVTPTKYSPENIKGRKSRADNVEHLTTTIEKIQETVIGEHSTSNEKINIDSNRTSYGRKSRTPTKYSPAKINKNRKFTGNKGEFSTATNEKNKVVDTAEDSTFNKEMLDFKNDSTTRKTRHSMQSITPTKYSSYKINKSKKMHLKTLQPSTTNNGKKQVINNVQDSTFNNENVENITANGDTTKRRLSITPIKYSSSKMNKNKETTVNNVEPITINNEKTQAVVIVEDFTFNNDTFKNEGTAKRTRRGRQSITPVKYSPAKINNSKKGKLDNVEHSTINEKDSTRNRRGRKNIETERDYLGIVDAVQNANTKKTTRGRQSMASPKFSADNFNANKVEVNNIEESTNNNEKLSDNKQNYIKTRKTRRGRQTVTPTRYSPEKIISDKPKTKDNLQCSTINETNNFSNERKMTRGRQISKPADEIVVLEVINDHNSITNNEKNNTRTSRRGRLSVAPKKYSPEKTKDTNKKLTKNRRGAKKTAGISVEIDTPVIEEFEASEVKVDNEDILPIVEENNDIRPKRESKRKKTQEVLENQIKTRQTRNKRLLNNEENPLKEEISIKRSKRNTNSFSINKTRLTRGSNKQVEIPSELEICNQSVMSCNTSVSYQCLDTNQSKRKQSSKSSTTSSKRSKREVSPSLLKEAVLWSPSQRQAMASKRPRVLFTSFKDEKDEKLVKDLGGNLVENVDDCNVLVTNSVRRTFKLLVSFGKGVPIVSSDWLIASRQAGNFVDPWEYLVNDTDSENKFGYNLKRSLKSASRKRLLTGYSIHVTQSVLPPPDEMRIEEKTSPDSVESTFMQGEKEEKRL